MPVSIQGRYRTGSGMVKDRVITDVSSVGCKFYDCFSILKEGTRLTIRIGNIGPLDTLVRWRTGQILGVQFDTALHPSFFNHMVTTISDWSLPQMPMKAADDKIEAEPYPDSDLVSICIRKPTALDFRTAIADLELHLPLAQEADVEAIFHHVLNGLFVLPSDD